MKISLTLFVCSLGPSAAFGNEPAGTFEGTLFQIGSVGIYLAASLLFGRAFLRLRSGKSNLKGGVR